MVNEQGDIAKEPRARIGWVNKATGRHGCGSHIFPQSEAQKLVQELNHDYPHIEHSVKLVETHQENKPSTPSL